MAKNKKLIVQQKKKHSIGDTLEIVDVMPKTVAQAVEEYGGDTDQGQEEQERSARRFVNDIEKRKIANSITGVNFKTPTRSGDITYVNGQDQDQEYYDNVASTKYVADQIQAEVTNKLGEANGFASLDDTGKVPATQLPSYVDDVIMYDDLDALNKVQGETGKIYVTAADDKIYRWAPGADADSGKFVEIQAQLTLGTGSGNAYRGDRGNELYNAVFGTMNQDSGGQRVGGLIELQDLPDKVNAIIDGKDSEGNLISVKYSDVAYTLGHPVDLTITGGVTGHAAMDDRNEIIIDTTQEILYTPSSGTSSPSNRFTGSDGFVTFDRHGRFRDSKYIIKFLSSGQTFQNTQTIGDITISCTEETIVYEIVELIN